MPQWAGSSWYYLRFEDPKNKKALVDPKKEITLLARDYLFKDVLRIETVRKPIILEKLAAMLAYQIGREYF